MSVYAVSEEGVESLNTVKDSVGDAILEINNAINTVQPVLDENSQNLGPHYNKLEEAILIIHQKISQSAESAEEVQQFLQDVISDYEEVIADTNYYVDADVNNGNSIGAKTLRR